MQNRPEKLISLGILAFAIAVMVGILTNGFGFFKTGPIVPAQQTLAPVWGGGNSAQVSAALPAAREPVIAVNSLPSLRPPAGVPGGVAVQQPIMSLVRQAQPLGAPINVPVNAPTGAMAGAMAANMPPDLLSDVAPNYIPENVQLFEAHWQGMDNRLLTPELCRKFGFPLNLRGALVGEVTMAAVRAGLLGGDVIVGVNGQAVTDLSDFQEATRAVAARTEATLSVMRKTGGSMQGLTLTLRSNRELGFAQAESAPMIKAGDPRPHSDRGACTGCHAIGTGFELSPDPDLISLPPPRITQAVAAKGTSPHADRGPCVACHIITQ